MFLLMSEWDPEEHFLDPMCGSGTFLVEAAMIKYKIPPGQIRSAKYAFENWENFHPKYWRDVKTAAAENVIEPGETPTIWGYDINKNMIELCYRHLHRRVALKQVAIADAKAPKDSKGTIVMNPPYGQRLEMDDIEALYQQIGDSFKHNFKNYTAWIFSGNDEAMKNVGLKTTKRYKMFNGSIPCRFQSYELY